jgi:hypothetical protein
MNANEAPPQTNEVYRSRAGDRRLCVRLILHAVGDTRDAIFDERDIEIYQ